ncbi:MAG: hypothetical protein R6X27_09135, partial [Candidatus Desulfacyla sp.]
MGEEIKKGRRSEIGFGSSYRKGAGQDLRTGSDIPTVLGGQVWMVKPDKRAVTSHPCIWMQAGAVEFKNCKGFASVQDMFKAFTQGERDQVIGFFDFVRYVSPN